MLVLAFGRSRALLRPRSNHRRTRRRPLGILFDQVVSNPWVSPSQISDEATRKSLPCGRKYTLSRGPIEHSLDCPGRREHQKASARLRRGWIRDLFLADERGDGTVVAETVNRSRGKLVAGACNQ